MKYNSVREYLYKLHNTLYAIILVPLVLFVFFYLEINNGGIIPAYSEEHPMSDVITYALCFLFLMDVVVAFVLYHRILQAKNALVSLGEKLVIYFKSVLVRSALLAGAGLLMAIGFFLTGNALFTIFFMIILAVLSLFWPTPNRIAKELQLKNDERKIIIQKGELN